MSRVGYDRRFSVSQWTTLLIIVQVFQPQPMLSGAYNPAHSHEIFIDPFRVGCQIPEKTKSSGKSSQRSGGCCSHEEGSKSLFIPLVLEWDV